MAQNQQQLDAMAKAHSFHDWNTMVQWHQRQNQAMGVIGNGAQQVIVPGGGGSPVTSVNNATDGAFSWHPAAILDWVAQKLHGALGNGQ